MIYAPSKPPRRAACVRNPDLSGDQGSFGQTTSDTGKTWVSLALPWRSDLANKSCVPPDPAQPGVKKKYLLRYQPSPIHKRDLYHFVNEVLAENADGTLTLGPLEDGRTVVELHSANFAGDADKGWFKQDLGCENLGKSRAQFPANTVPGQTQVQWGVTESKTAIAEFEKEYCEDGEQMEIVYEISWSSSAA